jgi:hypothetical protein
MLEDIYDKLPYLPDAVRKQVVAAMLSLQAKVQAMADRELDDAWSRQMQERADALKNGLQPPPMRLLPVSSQRQGCLRLTKRPQETQRPAADSKRAKFQQQ